MISTRFIAVLAMGTLIGTAGARADEPPAPVRPRDAVRRQWYPGLIFGGLVISSAAYAASAIASAVKNDVCESGRAYAVGCRTETWPLYVPFAGPFIQMGYIDGSGSSSAYALLVVDGAVQLGGLTMMIVGAVLSSRAAQKPVRASRIQVAPMLSGSNGGLVLGGTF